MPAAWKTVRVFISSTFRDMHGERDHVVKVVVRAAFDKHDFAGSTVVNGPPRGETCGCKEAHLGVGASTARIP